VSFGCGAKLVGQGRLLQLLTETEVPDVDSSGLGERAPQSGRTEPQEEKNTEAGKTRGPVDSQGHGDIRAGRQRVVGVPMVPRARPRIQDGQALRVRDEERSERRASLGHHEAIHIPASGRFARPDLRSVRDDRIILLTVQHSSDSGRGRACRMYRFLRADTRRLDG